MTRSTPCPQLLLVDDCPDIALIVKHLGRRAGHDIVSCPDVPAAWNHLQNTCPELLILDVNLPGESGLVLCDRIRASPRLTTLPIALFSHWDRSEDIVAGLNAGAEFVLSKDLLCLPEEWQARIAGILSHVHSRRSSVSLSWNEAAEHALSPARCIEIINKALHQPALKVLDQELLYILWRRAMKRAGWEPADTWLLPGNAGLRPDALGGVRLQDVMGLALALAEEIWCMMGTSGSVPFRAALAGMPGARENLAHS
jgi:DNA-binding response OmpR family regulator